MDFFKLLFFLLFLIQQIQSLFTNQLNDGVEYKIELTKNETNKIILHTENKLSVILKISNSSELEEESCSILDNELKCEIELEISNRKDLIFKDIHTNNTYNLYIHLIQYQYNDKYCCSDSSIITNIYLYSNLDSEKELLVNINDNLIKCTKNTSNILTCPFSLNQDISSHKLKVSHKNDNDNGDVKNMTINYYYSSIPKISNFFYPNDTDIIINLSFNTISSSIEKYKIYIESTII